jgi:AbiV family abortive infection protein
MVKRRSQCARSYPVSRIDEGVRNCIANSRRLLESAHLLFENNRFEHSFILYTYAEEEFGKALLLRDNKDNAQKKQEKFVENDEITFCNHKKKLERAEAYDIGLGLRLIDDSTIPVIDTEDLINWNDPAIEEKFRFKGRNEFEYEQDTYSKLDSRFNFLYVDFDERLLQWRKEPFRPNNFELQFAYEALRDALNKLEQQAK